MKAIVYVPKEEEESFFGPFYEFVVDDSITDIDFNGSELWISDCKNNRMKVNACVESLFLEQFSKKVSNLVSRSFNKQNPVLEAETDSLRITVVHESVANTGRCICIRKSPPYIRMSRKSMVEEGYASAEVIDLLAKCVEDHKNIVFCGEPGVGKTECAKFFSSFIKPNERVITIEDTLEWHYSSIYEGRDCVELKISEQMDYTQAIKTCLRLNPKWMMLSEARSTEVIYLIQSFSTGVKGLTTLHSDDVRRIPDRMINMAGGKKDAQRFENDIYSFVDVGVLISKTRATDLEGREYTKRYIDQICFFDRKDGKNIVNMVMDEGRLLENADAPRLVRKNQ